MELLNRLRTISYHYEVIRLLFVFLGGAVSVASSQYGGTEILKKLGEVTTQNTRLQDTEYQYLSQQINQTIYTTTQEQIQTALLGSWTQIVFFVLILFFVPIILSLVLTKISSEKRIVPPLYMQIVVFSYSIIYFTYNQQYLQPVAVIPLVGIYIFFAGLTQNLFVTWLIGITGHKQDMISYSLKTRERLERIEQVLLNDNFRTTLNLNNKTETTKNGLLIRNHSRTKYDITLELERGSIDNETYINIVFYEKGEFDIKRSSLQLKEYAIRQFRYLKDVLSRDENNIRFEEISSEHADHLVDSILEENKGAYTAVEGITKLDVFKIVMFIIAIAVSASFFIILKDNTNGFVILAIILLYLTFELPSRFGRKRHKE